MKLTISSRFDFGTIVYLRAGGELTGIVTGFMVRPGGQHMVVVSWTDHEEQSHFEFELTDTKSFS